MSQWTDLQSKVTPDALLSEVEASRRQESALMAHRLAAIAARDRLDALRRRFDTAARNPEVTEDRLAVLSAEIRLLEDAINRWVRLLNTDGSQTKPVSAQHQRAALSRWHGASA